MLVRDRDTMPRDIAHAVHGLNEEDRGVVSCSAARLGVAATEAVRLSLSPRADNVEDYCPICTHDQDNFLATFRELSGSFLGNFLTRL